MLAPVLLLMAVAAGAYLVMAQRSGISVSTISASSSAFQVIDGDTVRFGGERLRLLVIDAPEISSPRCPAEYQTGITAKNELSDFMFGRLVTVHYSGRRDVFGRPLVHLTVDGKDAGKHLLSKSLSIRYAWGKHISKIYWCGLW
jgi:endonuclease YncB( thermonuclease family)